MPSVSVTHDDLAVVVKGHFKAAIFSPAWLSKQQLIGPREYEAAEVELITADIAKFNCGWLRCLVTPDTLQFSTKSEDDFERVRDAVVGVLRILDQTPVGALGINRTADVEVGNDERWHQIGDTLVPKSYWNNVLTLPGLSNLTLWGVRPDTYAGRIQVAVEPSASVQYGIKIAYNDHYELTHVDHQPVDREEVLEMRPNIAAEASTQKSVTAREILRDGFQDSIERSNAMITHVSNIGDLK